MNNQCRNDDDVTTQSDNSVEQFDCHWSVYALIHAVIRITPQSIWRHKQHDVTIDTALHQSESVQNGFPCVYRPGMAVIDLVFNSGLAVEVYNSAGPLIHQYGYSGLAVLVHKWSSRVIHQVYNPGLLSLPWHWVQFRYVLLSRWLRMLYSIIVKEFLRLHGMINSVMLQATTCFISNNDCCSPCR